PSTNRVAKSSTRRCFQLSQAILSARAWDNRRLLEAVCWIVRTAIAHPSPAGSASEMRRARTCYYGYQGPLLPRLRERRGSAGGDAHPSEKHFAKTRCVAQSQFATNALIYWGRGIT